MRQISRNAVAGAGIYTKNYEGGSMNTYNGNVEITKENSREWNKKLEGVEHITGYLSINSQAKLEASSLKSVGGDLYINSQAKLDSLKSVGGDLYIRARA